MCGMNESFLSNIMPRNLYSLTTGISEFDVSLPDLGIRTIIDCLHVSGKVPFTQILSYSFSRHLTDSSGSCLRNSLCSSSGPTTEWLDFFMELIQLEVNFWIFYDPRWYL